MNIHKLLTMGIVLVFLVVGCKPPLQDSPSEDTMLPTPGAAIGFAGTSATSTTVSWGVASDDKTATADLQYKLVMANTSTAVDTVPKALTASVAMGWTPNTLSSPVTGLSANTTYYFAVIVKDAAGNMSLYQALALTTTALSDTTAPNLGTAILFSGTSGTSTTAAWGAASDNITPPASLQYKLVKGSSSTAIDTVAKADAVPIGDVVMSWSAGSLSQSAVGLQPSTTYYFAVLVKDAAGNLSLYAPQFVATSAEVTAPVVGTSIVFAGTTYTSTTVSWGAASDNATPVASLRYKLVMASSSAAIDTVAKANAISTGTGLVMDWTNHTLSKAATSLSDGTTYWFAVIVQDVAGNMSLYLPQSVATPLAADSTPPTAGTAIAFASTTMTGTTASWGAASDNATAQASLQYKLVKASTSAAIDTVAKVNAISGGDLVMDWTVAATSKAATGLSSATTYYFAALVKDAAGNLSLYTPQSVTTSSDSTPPTIGTAIALSNISSTSMTASWGAASDNVTAQSSLQYKLVKGASTSVIETVALANAIIGANLVMDWTTNATTKSVTGLSAITQYFFSVLVRDAAGNMSLYDVKWAQTSAVADTTPPTTGTGISFSGVSSNTATVSWGAGTDDVTAQSSLQYRLVKASTSAAIDTVAEANVITGADLVMDWTTNATSVSATSLSPSTTYYFSVVVRDAAGNSSLYSPQSTITTAAPDTTAPTTDTGISFSGTTSTSTTVNWGAGSDNLTPQASLQYKLVRASSASSIDTVAEADAISDSNLIMDWTANATSKTTSGLAAGTTYYFAAIVKDATGNKSLYSPASATTSTTSNLVYSLSSNPGWSVTGNWQWGTVTYDDGAGRYPTGSVVYGTGLTGPYSANMTFATNYVQAGPLNFSTFPTAAGFRMNFQGWFYVQNGSDFDVLQYSTDGTNFTLVPAACVSGYAYCPNPDPSILPQESWSPNWADAGSLPAWRSVTIDLGGLALNGKISVYFRWALSSSPSVQKGGFFIKDIDIGY